MLACFFAVPVPTGVFVLGAIGLAFLAAVLLSGLFGPVPDYRIVGADTLPPNDTEEFLHSLESLADAVQNRRGCYEVYTDGPAFYAAELAAIRAAQHSINLEAYIFQRGEITRQFIAALTERARAGVQVRVNLDFFGSLGTHRKVVRPLLEAGGRVLWYNSPAWHRLTRLDNRTHRELLIVDGAVGFIGGAGIADHWYSGVHGHPRWRDTVLRVEGDAVPNLQATFAENWLAASGELLAGKDFFPDIDCPDETVGFVVNSTPTPGGCTRARILFQLLLASARRSITITTPYFLPDKSLTQELCHAVRRGVRVRVITPGRKSDHLLTRSTSRGGYGRLLETGAEIHEYETAMIHAKVLTVDDLWTVVGSTNFDNRSFGINDEVNLAVRSPELAARMAADFATDLAASRPVTLDEWRHRPVTERAPELLGWIFERQQ